MSRDFWYNSMTDHNIHSGEGDTHVGWANLNRWNQKGHSTAKQTGNRKGDAPGDNFQAGTVEQVIVSFALHFKKVMEHTDVLRDEVSKYALEQFHLRRIQDSCEQGANLLYRLMVLYGKMPKRTELFDLNDIVRSIDPFILRIEREDISFEIDMADEDLPMLGDVSFIKQAIVELISNAKDALPDGGTIALATRKVGVTQSSQGKNGGCALLSVVDTGTGIDGMMKPKIFQSFYTTKEAGKGAGLGLPLVDRIVRVHNGSIRIMSRKGEGTSVRLYLPILRGLEI